MFASIFDDFKRNIRSGNMVTKIILVNLVLFVVINLIKVFTFFGNSGDTSSIYTGVFNFLAVPSAWGELIRHPWTLISYMFFHEGIWHILWNMLLLYWFASIVGDFIGDDRVLPIYLLGGLAGAFLFILTDNFLFNGAGGSGIMLGASAGVMCMVFVAATLSPDYTMHLILLGPVRIKYIALVLLFLDLIGVASFNNSGGHFAHLGGAIMGLSIVYFLRKGIDFTEPFVSTYNKIKNRFEEDKKAKTYEPKLELVHVNKNQTKKSEPQVSTNFQDRLDEILDKINTIGYENLSEEEKQFLNQASKRDE